MSPPVNNLRNEYGDKPKQNQFGPTQYRRRCKEPSRLPEVGHADFLQKPSWQVNRACDNRRNMVTADDPAPESGAAMNSDESQANVEAGLICRAWNLALR